MRGTGLALLSVLLAAPFLPQHRFLDRTPSPNIGLFTHSEVVRLRAHFDSVNGELRQRDLSELSLRQRVARAQLVTWLRDYRNRGAFPMNDRFPGRAVPFFRDARGVLCAMAYLVRRSGRRDLVDRIARDHNNAFIKDMSSDRELGRWLDSMGLSLREAARIQPSYGFPGPGAAPGSDRSVSASYAFASILVSGGGLLTVSINAVAPSRRSGWLGLLAGAGGIATGLAHIAGPSGTAQIALTDMAIGTASVIFGVHALLRTGTNPSDSPPQQAAQRSHVKFAVMPAVIPTPHSPRFGVVVRASF